MIIVKVNGQEYRVASDWKDITIADVAKVLSIQMPDSLKAVYTAAANREGLPEEQLDMKIKEAESAISFDDQYKSIPRYFSKVLGALSDIPGDVLKKTSSVTISTIYHKYLQRLVEGVTFQALDYQYRQIEEFEWDGVVYKLPQSREVFGVMVPMVSLTALEFTESADMMIHAAHLTQSRDFTKVANLISIVCRPEGEEYNEEVSLARAKEFLNLPMDIVWDVFFSLIAPSLTLGLFGKIFSETARAERSEANMQTR